MPVDSQGLRKSRTKVWLALAAVLILLALVFVPPFISLNHYKMRLSQLVSASVGRPVRLSDVELRLLPRPGFLITDLTVQEDPKYGAEPVLHANTVMASIRLTALWRGRLEISRISVDEASLNLVRMSSGEWNFDSLFRSAAAGAGKGAARAQQPPYLEATNSRINIKIGLEKLPFSLLEADASMWRESDGAWRVRLRAQPVRTDVSLDMEDTGVVRLEATVHPTAQLYEMPLHLDLDWREAQLGQLTRLLLSSDEGWRGDLTGELHLDGTAESAKVQGRLRAAGVHRVEFAPAAPMDFDANCSFTFHYGSRSVEGVRCESPVGDGRARLTGDVQGGLDVAGRARQPKLTLELDRVPAQAALDLLRTMRNTIDPSLEAQGAVSGRMTYDPAAVEQAAPPMRKAPGRAARGVRAAQAHVPRGPLTGAFNVAGLRISGNALSRPIEAASVTVEPVPFVDGQQPALATSISIPAGGPAPLAVSARLALNGFALGVHGTASIARLREFAHLAGSPAESALAQLAGEPAALDFAAAGPWVPPTEITLAAPAQRTPSIRTSGTLTLRDANWKAPFLANPVMISAATLQVVSSNGVSSAVSVQSPGAATAPMVIWDPVEFSYGAVKGIATVDVPAECNDPQGCPIRFTVKFGELDAAEVQGALLGAHEPGTLLSSLLDRLKPNSAPAWPQLEGTAAADSLVLGPVTLTNLTAQVKVVATGAEVSSLDAGLQGGKLHGSATLLIGDKPDYKIDATMTQADPAELGVLAGLDCSGTLAGADVKLELTGYSAEDLAHSAKGEIHFDWRRGAVSGAGAPAALGRFDRWTGDATIADGGMKLGSNQVQRGSRAIPVGAAVTFGSPVGVSFAAGGTSVSQSAHPASGTASGVPAEKRPRRSPDLDR